ncbi:integrase arm-type DNA-binding domain-containing protein [Enterobacter cloacae]|nr:integrase arm-type DNA-binding domain-containing protein [Enterobacter cloacae]
MALIDIQIKRAKPQDKPYTLNDGHGLPLLIDPDGSKDRSWRFRFRFAGKARLMPFDGYDSVSLAEGRAKRGTAHKQVTNNIGPVEELKAQKLAQQFSTENSFEAISQELHTNKADRWKMAYREKIIKTFEKDFFPFVGKPHY